MRHGISYGTASLTARCRYVTYGNHECDVPYDEMLKRIDESNFVWINTNMQVGSGLGTHKAHTEYSHGEACPVSPIVSPTVSSHRVPHISHLKCMHASVRIGGRVRARFSVLRVPHGAC